MKKLTKEQQRIRRMLDIVKAYADDPDRFAQRLIDEVGGDHEKSGA